MTEPTNEYLEMERIFDAPRERVYRAFVDPDQLAMWFSPVGWTVPRESVSIDARVGGHQRFTMASNDNPEWARDIEATFTEVVENELLVGVQSVEGMPGFEGIVSLETRLEFHDEKGKTRLVLRQGPYTGGMTTDGATMGWESSFTKLDGVLAGR